MTKRNKILLTIVLTAFVALSTCLVVSAQAPEITTNNNPNLVYYNVLVYDDLGSQGDNVLAYFHVRVSLSTYQLYSIDCVLTEYYYSEYYLYDYVTDLSGSYDISISSKTSGDQGGAGSFYDDEYIVEALNHFNYFYYSGNPNNDLVNSTTISNCVDLSTYNQFTYWENRIQNAKDVAFDNGFAEGQQTGLQVGYGNGYNDGYNDAISDSDAYLEGLFAVFDAPFVFLENLSSFSVFGITIIDVVTFLLIICFALFIYKVIRRFLPI